MHHQLNDTREPAAAAARLGTAPALWKGLVRMPRRKRATTAVAQPAIAAAARPRGGMGQASLDLLGPSQFLSKFPGIFRWHVHWQIAGGERQIRRVPCPASVCPFSAPPCANFFFHAAIG